MKRNLFLTVLAICAVLMAACRQETPSTKSVDDNSASYSMEKIFENDTLIVYKTDKGYTVSDTIHKEEDHDYIQHNVFVADQQGRPFAIGIYDKEEYKFEVTKYLYDKNGNVRGLVIYDTSYDIRDESYYSYDDLMADSIFDSQFDIDDEKYDVREKLFDLIFAKNNDEPYFTRYYFLRDSQNRIIKMYDPILYNSVAAPEDYHIEYHIEFISIFSVGKQPLLGKWFTFVSNEKNEEDKIDGYEFYKYPTIIIEIDEDENEEND